ncbi:MAG: ECF transporter S component [Oenococcus sp.]|uniref:ECF transporter S component n=1 Tax=Oenococcus sp. TaxID=1979414 RepID=UPI0039E95B32
MTAHTSTKNWRIRDVILIGLIGVIFGILFFAFGIPWNTMVSLSGPLVSLVSDQSLAQTIGASQISEQVATAATIGLWIMAGPIAGMIIKKPGASLLGETLAATVEMAVGSAWGISDILSGLIQGAGTEAGFALTGYKRPFAGLWLSTLTSTVITFGFTYFQNSYNRFPISYTLSLFVISYLSILIFAGIVVYLIYTILKKAKLIK